MQPKRVNQEIKKNFILYKGHTGWKVKTRIFGSLLVTFSTLAMLGTVNEVTGQAATTATDVSSETPAAAQPASTPTSNTNQPTTAADNTTQPQVNQSSTPTGDRNSGSDNVTVPTDATDTAKTATVPEAESVTADTNQTTTYPVLSPNNSVNVGADTTQVSLTADQIGGHFTATVENRGDDQYDNQYMDKDTDPTDNKHTVKIGTDGTVDLTSNDSHPYYISAGQSMTVTGHQVAHVSFEHEIDFSHNFSMSGALGIGSKSSGGADSVGFVFAPGDPAKATEGGSGGELGIGGLANAFGFVFDEYYNRDKNDPSSSPYIGWRTTDANRKLQRAASTDWKLASQAGLNNRSVNTLNDFRMNYDATTQMLTVVLGKIALTRKITDVSSGYSVSVSASTGGNSNDYSARIEQFSYTPKTIPLTINLVDSADNDAPLNKTNANVIANIGDTVSVFSTQAAADRAVALGEVKPNLVSVLPTDSAGNVYVIDSSATIANNKGTAVHYIGGTQNKALADATYYTYTVADGDGQNMTVPVRLAFTAVVTPVDSQTQQPIPGLQPVTVVTVAGEPALVQIPGYTPTQVVLDAPADGQKTAYDNLLINQTTANPDGTTPTKKTSDAIAHYYTATGTTVDGQTVTTTGTVGTGQAVADNLNGQPFKDAAGNPIASGGQTTIGQNDYYWSEVGNATATDSTDASHPQTAGSVLVPTAATLKYWDQQAIANQTDADNYKAEAQDTFNQFVALKGLTEAQTKTARASLDALKDLYDKVSNSNGVAKANFEKAMQETDPATIYQDGQTGYASLMIAINFLANFKADVEKLDTKNTDAKASLVTLVRMDRVYGEPIGVPDADFGAGFGTLTPEQQADFNQANYFEFVNQADMSGGAVVPKNVGSYMVNVTDAGRAYLRSLNPDNPNLGLFVSTFLTISPKPVNATINTDSETDKAVKVTYGDTPEVTGDLDGMIDSDKAANSISPSDFEVIDTATGKTVSASDLQVTGQYTVQYTAAAQAKFKKNANYDFNSFGSAKLTVTPKAITVTAQDTGKAYGDQADPTLTLTSDSSAGLVNGDQLADLGVKLSRKTGKNADSYDINLDPSSVLNSNYAVTVTPGTFTIAKLPVTVTVASDEIHYGDKTPSFKLADDAKAVLVNGDDLTKLGAITYTCDREKSIGNYTISGSATDLNSNYTVTVKDGTLKVTPRPVTITADALSKYYGDLKENLTFKVAEETPLVPGETKDKLGVTLTRVTGDNVGSYPITMANPATNANYKVTLTPNTKFTIAPRPVTITADKLSKYYGDSKEDLTFKVAEETPLAPGETKDKLGVTLTRETGDNVGSYLITMPDPAANANYDVTLTPNTKFTITPRPVTIEANTLSKYYGDSKENLTFKVAEETPLAPGETKDKLGVTLTRETGDNVGSYLITMPDPAANANYDVTLTPNTKFTITPRPVTITADTLSKYYGDLKENLTFEVAEETPLAPGETKDKLGVTLTRETGDNVGSYLITMPDPAANANYDVTLTPNTKFTITPRPVTITADTLSKYYGDLKENLTFEVAEETPLAPGETKDKLGVTLTRVTGDNVGSYPIMMANPATNANYDVTLTPNTKFTIAPRPVTITADKLSKYYGDSKEDLTFKVAEETPLAPGETKDKLGVTLTRVAGDNVGSYPITMANPATNANYDVTLTPNTKFTIAPRPVTITADKLSKYYGDSDPRFTYKVVSKIKPLLGDDLGVTLIRADKSSNVNSYVITMPDPAANANYDVTLTPNTQFTITPRPVTITADTLSKYYGDSDPRFTYTVTSEIKPLSGDDLGVTLTRAKGKNVDSYTITMPDPATNGNYKVTLTSNTQFTINPLRVTVKATNQTKVYGTHDSELTLDDPTAILVKGDKETDLKVTLGWDHNQNVGDHQITGTTTPSNYQVTVIPGTLKITPASASLEISDVKLTYGDQPIFNEKFSAGLRLRDLNQTDFEVVDQHNTVIAPDQLKADGNYTIRLTDAGKAALLAATPNYKFTEIKLGQLVVAKRKVTVQVANQLQYAGTTTPQNDISLVAGTLFSDDDLSALRLALTTPDTRAVGTYAITAVAENANYDVTVLPGQLTVLGRDVAADGTVTITEKDADGQVVRVTKQWPDQTTTIYSNDPSTNQQVVTELVDQRVVSQQTITPGNTRVILPDGTGAVTVVNVIDPENPSFEHYAIDPDGDGVSSADELAMGTDPLKADTDGDGIDDGTELRNHTNPLVADAPQKLEEPQRVVAQPQVATVKPLTSTVATQQSTPSKQSATKLPQTSDEASHGLAVLGLLLMTFLTGLVTRKRH